MDHDCIFHVGATFIIFEYMPLALMRSRAHFTKLIVISLKIRPRLHFFHFDKMRPDAPQCAPMRPDTPQGKFYHF